MRNPEELIAARAPQWAHRPHIFTDPIAMELELTTDPALRQQLSAARLEAHAAVHRSIADAAQKTADILKRQ